MEIYFHNRHKKKIIFSHNVLIKRFEKIAFFESRRIGLINYIFVDDRTILLLNKKFLNHNYPTDVITFDYSHFPFISGDIYISLDTVKVNCGLFQTSFRNELNRVMVHGILHLLKYGDKNDNEIRLMRSKENYYLKIFNETL